MDSIHPPLMEYEYHKSIFTEPHVLKRMHWTHSSENVITANQSPNFAQNYQVKESALVHILSCLYSSSFECHQFTI